MADAKPKKSAPKFFDVAKPGKSAPSATSKPVLITNRPVLKDPMVIRVDGVEEDTSGAETVTVDTEMKHKVDVQPLHIDLSDVLKTDEPEGKKTKKSADDTPEPEDTEASAPTDEPEEESPAEEVAEEPAKSEAPEATKEDEKTETPETPKEAEKADEKEDEKPAEPTHKTSGEKVIQPPTPTAPEEKPAGVTPAPDPEPEVDEEPLLDDGDEASLDNSDTPVLSEKEAKATEAAKKQSEEQEKIIASGQYYLPINSVEKRRTRRNLILGTLFVIVLLAVAALAAWDAGVFSIPGYTPPTDFL